MPRSPAISATGYLTPTSRGWAAAVVTLHVGSIVVRKLRQRLIDVPFSHYIATSSGIVSRKRYFVILRSIVNIEQKLEQLYAALADMQVTEKLLSLKPTTKIAGNQFVTSIDFTKGTNRPTAENRVTLLINNIACLKDHLKSWCKKNGKPFTGDQLR